MQQFIHSQIEVKPQVKRNLKINKLPTSDSVIVSRSGSSERMQNTTGSLMAKCHQVNHYLNKF